MCSLGETLILHEDDRGRVGAVVATLDLVGATVTHRRSFKTFGFIPPVGVIRVKKDQSYRFRFGTPEEAKIWGRTLKFATNHRFEDGFRLDECVPMGTSGVFPCTSLRTGAKLAVKIADKADKEMLQEVEHERHINLKLKISPLIVQAVNMFSTVDRHSIVFEHMAGGSLRDLLDRKEKLSEPYARAVFKQVFKSLQFIHGEGVVHGDIQPGNIFCYRKRSGNKRCWKLSLSPFRLRRQGQPRAYGNGRAFALRLHRRRPPHQARPCF